MSSAVFGGPGGSSLAISDLGRMAQTDLEQAQAERSRALLPGDLALQPVNLQHQQALGRLAAAQAGEHEANIKESQTMADVMRNLSTQGGQAPDPLTLMPGLISGAIQGGAPRKAMDLMQKYEVLVGHKNAADAQAAKARYEDAQMMLKANQWASERMSTVQNEQDWNDAAVEFGKIFPEYQKAVGKPAPWADKPYSPEMVKVYQQASMSENNRIARQLQQDRLLYDQQRDERKEMMQDIKTQLKAEQDKRKQDEKDALARAGGKNLGQPSKDLVAQAARLIKRENEGTTFSNDDLMSAATTIASEASATMRNNRAVTPDAALYRAYGEAKQRGDIETTPGTEGGFFSKGTPATAKYRPKQFAPGSKDNPIPATPGLKPEDGKHYTKNGQVWVVKGDHMELVQ